MKKSFVSVLSVFSASSAALVSVAGAHEGHVHEETLLQGLLHPFTGIDHLALLILPLGIAAVSVAIKREGRLFSVLAMLAVFSLSLIHAVSHGGAGAFSVNFLTEDQSEVARSFSASGRGEAGPFDHGVWRPGPTGAPLLDDAVAAFECRLEREMESGAHVILLGRVERQAAGTGGGLLYRDGFLRRVATE